MESKNLIWYIQWIVILSTIQTSMMERNESNFERALELLCPYNKLCNAKSAKLIPNDDYFVGCCSDCSCDESCGLTENCCLPEMDIHNIVDRSHQQCLSPSTLQEYIDGLPFYNMVVDSYPDGKGVDCGDGFTTCGEDEYASPIGALYPVFSNKTGRVYKNFKCAKCHGLNEQDVIYWKVVLQCDNVPLYDDYVVYVDVSAAFNCLEKSKLSKNCNYIFYYPGLLSDIESERCMGNQLKFECIDDFYIDTRLNMTKEEIRSICYSGLKLPIYDMFVNTFCYICTNQYSNIIHYPFLCQKNKSATVKSIPGSAFTSLIIPQIYQIKLKGNNGNESKEKMACPKLVQNKNQTSGNCRLIVCPTGQLRKQDGKCIFPTRVLNFNSITLTIHLKPSSRILEKDLISQENDPLSLFTLQSPWSPAWEIMAIMYSTYDIKDGLHEELVIESFMITLHYTQRYTPIEKVLSNIEKILALPWLVNINNSTIANTQAHSKYNRQYKVTKQTVAPIPYSFEQKKLPSYIREANNPVFTVLFDDRVAVGMNQKVPITKTFFCDQIELNHNEFEMLLELGVFYHKMQNRIFYQGEFAYIFDDNGERIPRICLEDSRFSNEHELYFTNSCALSIVGHLTSLLSIYILHSFCVYVY